MTDIAHRLAKAREAAGFATVQDAVNRFGWTYATYASHENGHRGIRKEVLAEYARAYRVDLAWLLDGRTAPGSPPSPATTGMAEPAVGFTPAQAATVPVDMMIARTLAPQVRRPMAYRIARAIPTLLLDAGDTVIIDTDSNNTTSGVVVVNILTPDQTDAATQLRRAHQGILIATDPDDPEPAILADGTGRCGVIGQIIASYRTTAS